MFLKNGNHGINAPSRALIMFVTCSGVLQIKLNNIHCFSQSGKCFLDLLNHDRWQDVLAKNSLQIIMSQPFISVRFRNSILVLFKTCKCLIKISNKSRISNCSHAIP